MTNLIGYLALSLNLISMVMNNIKRLRILSFFANGIYTIYGVLLKSPPLIIGCGLAAIIHLFFIIKLKK
jgi:hypothetical protein